MRYRKKPVEVEAFRIGTDPKPNWFKDKINSRKVILRHEGDSADIHTLEGVMHASPGDYIILGVQGEIYPCKPDIFEMTYEKVTESEKELII